ncbi:type II secretion system F family protein [Streptomyces zingiberis]|uniref:type II secretion system F family protein n=1 Tax=Streptomyces zingiberis TaxID=2053010 RepID=UPI0035D4FFEA
MRVPEWWERARAWGGPAWWCLPAGGLVGLVGASPLPVVAAAAGVPVVRRLLRRRQRARDRERLAAEVIEWCAVVAAELRAGRQPGQALLGFPPPGGGEAAVRAAARYGGDVAEALRRAARRPGAAGLGGAAACWQAAAGAGAGLASGLERVAVALRAERDQREDLRSQLAGTRSTAALLALLPVFGLLMGGALGAGPLRVLLHTPPGLACLLTGAALEAAGLAWTGRIVRAAEEDAGLGRDGGGGVVGSGAGRAPALSRGAVGGPVAHGRPG